MGKVTKNNTVNKEKQGEFTKYDPSRIEAKWQKKWDEENLYLFKEDPTKKKYYTLVEWPYPSGDLHIGHWFSFATADVHARVHKMQGENIFFTNGFDAFGLPAENAAIKRGIHPQDWTMQNIKTMRKQFSTMGTMIDWSHEAIACLPEYYKWNQWIFIQMYKKGLAYRGKAWGNWCPKDLTVLANEHVENGKCWRCGTQVVQKEIEQWFLKITQYADKLLWPQNPLVDWPTSVRVAQNQWIGKKEGMKIKHTVVNSKIQFDTFTAYPAWSWADTYIVIAPEHPLVKELIKGTGREKQVMNFIKETAEITSSDRNEDNFEKKGVFTGRYAKDPFGGEDMPIWVANFALMTFGTGIVRCSGHDPRDIEFATKYHIPVKEVVERENSNTPVNAHDNRGILKNSGIFSGREVNEVVEDVKNWIEKEKIGERYVNYHIHDWSISRQRYWGTPVPMIFCQKDGLVPVPDEQLPVILPYDVDFSPKGEPPLASAKEWLKVKCPVCGGDAKRDPETLDTFFDSSWYFFRYLDPKYTKGPFPKSLAEKLMPVDIYFGGAEHTLGHTLYARFFTKFFQDLGLISFGEFASKRVQHGVILGTDGSRMSKSKGNVVNPDEIVQEYGADAVRLYLCFMMPYDATAPWDSGGMWGVYRFLKRTWDLKEKIKETNVSHTDLFQMHTAIKKVGEDAGATKFNTGVSTLMKWINYLSAKPSLTLLEYKTFLLLLAPFAPHISEELWQSLEKSDSNYKSIHSNEWPSYNNEYLKEKNVSIVLQVDGKIKGMMSVSLEETSEEEIQNLAKANSRVANSIANKKILKVVYVTGKILNFVTV